MAKDAYWFPHDAGARNDPKMARLRRVHKHGGVGVYWHLIEMLREAVDDGYAIPLSAVDDIAYDARFERPIFDTIVECGLLAIDDDSFSSPALIRRMEKWDAKRRAGRKGGKARVQNASKTEAKPKSASSKTQAKRKSASSKTEAKVDCASGNNRTEEKRIEQKRNRTEQKRTEEKKEELTPLTREQKPGVVVWESYETAYASRYGVSPVRNAKSNTMCLEVVKRLGSTEAPMVAAYYVGLQDAYYIGKKHPLWALVKDCEGIRTEWATGNVVTQAGAREQERLAEQGASWGRIKQEFGE